MHRRPRSMGWGLVAVALVMLAGCARGEGPVVSQTRELDAFSRIEAGAGVHLSVHFGAAAPLVVHAQENIQDKVRTGVRDGVLRVEAVDDFVVADPVVIDVVIPVLDSVSLSGGAQIEVSGVNADAIDISLSGGSRATISGAAGSVTLGVRGGAVASLANLDAEHVSIALDGGSTAEVHASATVNGTASGGAQLRVSGDASVSVGTSGGARVDHS